MPRAGWLAFLGTHKTFGTKDEAKLHVKGD
jgi:hypothetical protein